MSEFDSVRAEVLMWNDDQFLLKGKPMILDLLETLEKIRSTYCGCWDKCRCGSDKLNKIAEEFFLRHLKELK